MHFANHWQISRIFAKHWQNGPAAREMHLSFLTSCSRGATAPR
jgi:hypothetical protein